MIYTFDDLRRQVLRQLDEEDDSETTKTLASDYLNQAHQKRAMEYQQYFLLHPREETITTTVGVQRYTLNPLVENLLYLRNDSESLLMRHIPNRGLNTGEFDWKAEEGSASEYMLWGHSHVKAQPAAASVMTVSSSSSSDTGTLYQVVVKGITADGDIAADLITLNGQTSVNGTIEFVEVLTVTKSGEFNGILTVVDSESQTILTLGALEMGKQYRQIFLVQEPTESETLSYRFYRKPLILVNDYDVPDIPSPYSQLLVWDACLLFAGYNTDIRSESVGVWRDERNKWKEALDEHVKEATSLNAQPLFVINREGDFSGEWPQFPG
jgi:hypothetical protein